MKKVFILLGLAALGFSNAQETNVTQLKVLKEKYQLIEQNNEKFKEQLAAQKGISVDELNKSLIGKYGDFLVYIDDLDTDQVKATNADFLYDNTIAGVAVSGEGMTIYQWDGGRIETDHRELEGRSTNMEPEDVSLSDHSTGVAGIMIGTGIIPQSVGTAPAASVIGYDYYSNYQEMADESALNPDYMLSNHSYGYQSGWRYGEYDEELGEGWYWFGYPSIDENESIFHGIYSYLDEYFDELAEEAPNHLMIKSAGNDRNVGPSAAVEHAVLNDMDEWEVSQDYRPRNCQQTGYDCIPYGSVAKNILLVGSINQISSSGRYTGPDSVTPSNFSSFGPTDDGRIKPDVVAQGSSVYAPITGNDYYPQFSGTSASSPSVTGVATLLQQLYFELNDSYLNASELKALIINTTNETGEFDGPDYQYGFGLVDAFQAANLIVNETNNQAIILKGQITDEANSYNLIATGAGPIKATLVWIDPAKDTSTLPFDLNDRTPMLINDLDMRIVENASGTSYAPWTLDFENPSEAAVPGDNVLDNVEQVVIQNPTSTAYTLNIDYKNSLENDEQYYALVVSGATLQTQGTSDVVAGKGISIYPNPVQDKLYVDGLDLTQSYDIKIFTMDGKLARTQTLSDTSINVSNLTPGDYIAIIKNDKETVGKKFIKK